MPPPKSPKPSGRTGGHDKSGQRTWTVHAGRQRFAGRPAGYCRRMSTEDNKALIRRYIQAIDDNHSSDWSIIDEFVAEEFVAHNPPLPGVSLDRDGLKQAAEIPTAMSQSFRGAF